MYKARYYKADGKKGRARALPESLFDGVVNEAVLHQVVKAQLANRRQGTAAAKTRSEVRGGASKPWRQKGTGRARQGSIRAVQWEGGGVAFPPVPHSWRQRVPRKVKALARRSAFNDRAEKDRVVLVDLPALERPRTRELRSFLAALGVAEEKVLLLTDGRNEITVLSARNLPGVRVAPFGEESVYDVVWAHTVLIERAALDRDERPAAAVSEPEGDAAEPEEVAAVASGSEVAAEPGSDDDEANDA